jgi:cell division protein FtsQ
MPALSEDEDEMPRRRRKRGANARRGGAPAYVRASAKKRRKRAEIEDEDDNASETGLVGRWWDDFKSRLKRSAVWGSVLTGFFGAVALTGVITGGYIPVALGMAFDGFSEYFGKSGLQIETVTVLGDRETPKAQLIAALGVRQKGPLLSVDVHAIRQRLEALPWILRADVRRVWPNRIEVLVVERRPVALWQSEGNVHVIDRDGRAIQGQDTGQFGHLLLVVGQGAAEQASPLLELLGRQPELRSRVKAAVRVGQRRWNLRLDNGVEVRLPEEGAEAALKDLARLDREQQILAREIDAIDMRFPDRLIVKLPASSPLNPVKPIVEGKDT